MNTGFNPEEFAPAAFDAQVSRPVSNVHIRVQQRGGGKKQKHITIVEGLAPDLDLKKIGKALKRTFDTSCAIKTVLATNGEPASVLQLGGDVRNEVKKFFIEYKIVGNPDPEIVVHGF